MYYLIYKATLKEVRDSDIPNLGLPLTDVKFRESNIAELVYAKGYPATQLPFDSATEELRSVANVAKKVGDKWEIETNRYKVVEKTFVVPKKVPKYLLLGVLKLWGYVDIERQVKAAIAGLPEPSKTFADLGWRHESVLYRNVKLLKLVQAGVLKVEEDGSVTHISDEDMDRAFIAAEEESKTI